MDDYQTGEESYHFLTSPDHTRRCNFLGLLVRLSTGLQSGDSVSGGKRHLGTGSCSEG